MRIAKGIDERIDKMQYGFRKSKSTGHALYVCRRLQDIAEAGHATDNKLVLLLLDWEKAFDKVY